MSILNFSFDTHRGKMKISGEVVSNFNAAFEAILNNDLEELKQVLRSAPRSTLIVQLTPTNLPTYLSVIGIKKFSLLHVACYLGQISLIKELVKYGADITALDETFNASCLHWSVFGQQRETGLYLFFDLGCSIEVRNRFKQTPRELFASAKDVWDFLIPTAYKSDRLIEAFQKVIQTECRHKGHSSPVKVCLLLLNLKAFSKIMDSIQAGSYGQNGRFGVEMFFSDLRELFNEGRRFYANDAEMKKILKNTKKLFKKEVFYSGVDSRKKTTRPLIPINFSTKPLGEVENEVNPFRFIESVRISLSSCDESWTIREEQGADSRCFFYPLPSQSSSGQANVRMKMLPEGRSLLPALFVNTQRITTFTSAERSFEWTFSVKAGNNIFELFATTIKESDGRQRPRKTAVIQTTGEIRHFFTYFIFCTNQ